MGPPLARCSAAAREGQPRRGPQPDERRGAGWIRGRARGGIGAARRGWRISSGGRKGVSFARGKRTTTMPIGSRDVGNGRRTCPPGGEVPPRHAMRRETLRGIVEEEKATFGSIWMFTCSEF
jgi:hypothetical protein